MAILDNPSTWSFVKSQTDVGPEDLAVNLCSSSSQRCHVRTVFRPVWFGLSCSAMDTLSMKLSMHCSRDNTDYLNYLNNRLSGHLTFVGLLRLTAESWTSTQYVCASASADPAPSFYLAYHLSHSLSLGSPISRLMTVKNCTTQSKKHKMPHNTLLQQ